MWSMPIKKTLVRAPIEGKCEYDWLYPEGTNQLNEEEN